MYRSSNHVAIGVLTILTLLHFVYILIQHVKNQLYEKYYQTPKSYLLYLDCFKEPTWRRSIIHPNVELITEVTYNYTEFEESLIGLNTCCINAGSDIKHNL